MNRMELSAAIYVIVVCLAGVLLLLLTGAGVVAASRRRSSWIGLKVVNHCPVGGGDVSMPCSMVQPVESVRWFKSIK